MSRMRVNNFRLEAKRGANQCFAVRVVDSGNLARMAWLDTDIDDEAKLLEWANHWSEMEGLVFVKGASPEGQPLILNRVTVSNYQREIRMILQTLREEPKTPRRQELEQRIQLLNSRLVAGDRIEGESSANVQVDLDKRAKLVREWANECAKTGIEVPLNEWIEKKTGGEVTLEAAVEEELLKDATKL